MRNDTQREQGVFNELFGSGQRSFLEPDEVVYCVLIKGYSSRVDISGKVLSGEPQWNKIRGVFRAMEENGVTMTSATFNTLLSVCVDANDTERAAEVMDQMYDTGVLPDQNTFEIVRHKKNMRAHFKRVFGE